MHIAFKPRPAVAGTLLAILMPAQVMSGAALASADFDGYAVVSNAELDAMRGGFEINIGGHLLNLAFSLERVTYLNGELQALTRIVVPDIAAAIASPGTVSIETYIAQAAPAAQPGAGETGGGTLPATTSPGETSTQQATGESAAASPAGGAPQIATAVVPAPGGSVAAQDATALVTLIQNGAGNSVALPANVSQQVTQAIQAAQAQVLQATNQITVIQNTLDDQIIRNMTTLNVTLTNAALARAAELNSALQNLRNMPIGVQP